MVDEPWVLANEDGSEYRPSADRAGPGSAADGGAHVYMPWGLFRWLIASPGTRGGQQPPTMCVWYVPSEGVWKGVLHNRVARASLFRSAPTLGELVLELGDALQQEPAGWKADRRSQ